MHACSTLCDMLSMLPILAGTSLTYVVVFCRELKASFNLITEVPSEIGKLKRLRKLSLNGNRIRTLPPEVGRLEMLEELIVSENQLDEMPHTLATMAMLRILKVINIYTNKPISFLIWTIFSSLSFTAAKQQPSIDSIWASGCCDLGRDRLLRERISYHGAQVVARGHKQCVVRV